MYILYYSKYEYYEFRKYDNKFSISLSDNCFTSVFMTNKNNLSNILSKYDDTLNTDYRLVIYLLEKNNIDEIESFNLKKRLIYSQFKEYRTVQNLFKQKFRTELILENNFKDIISNIEINYVKKNIIPYFTDIKFIYL